MPKKLLIDRFVFSVAEAARVLLADLVEDCHSWEIRVEDGMLYVDVIEPASASQAGEDEEASPALQAATANADEAAEAQEVESDEIEADRLPAGSIGSEFAAEVEAAADAEEAEKDEGDEDPFWDTSDGEANDSPAETTVDGEPTGKKRATLAQLAGILCNEGGFQKFIYASNKDEAAVKLRAKCGVESRADLDKDEAAGRKFRDLKRDYDLWLGGE